jgi:hypothetical protein
MTKGPRSYVEGEFRATEMIRSPTATFGISKADVGSSTFTDISEKFNDDTIRGTLYELYDLAGIGSSTATFNVIIVAATDSPSDVPADFSCDGTDDDAQIRLALIEVAGGGIIHMLPGSYVFGASVTIDSSNVTIFGAGKESTKITQGNTDDPLFYVDTDNVSFMDINLTSGSPGITTNYGVQSNGKGNLSFRNVLFSGAYYGFYDFVGTAQDIQFENCAFQYCFRGIYAKVVGVLVDHCKFYDGYISSRGCDFYFSERVKIQRSEFSNLSSGLHTDQNTVGVQILENEIRQMTIRGIISYSTESVIIGNQLVDIGLDAFQLDGSRMIVNNNIIRDCTGSGIENLSFLEDSILQGNIISDVEDHGIRLNNAVNVLGSQNKISDVTPGGVLLQNLQRSTFEKNDVEIRQGATAGIEVQNTTSTRLMGNTINTGDYGIVTTRTNRYLELNENTLLSNRINGILVDDVTGTPALIKLNTVSGLDAPIPEIGIYINSDNRPIVSGNNFVEGVTRTIEWIVTSRPSSYNQIIDGTHSELTPGGIGASMGTRYIHDDSLSNQQISFWVDEATAKFRAKNSSGEIVEGDLGGTGGDGGGGSVSPTSFNVIIVSATDSPVDMYADLVCGTTNASDIFAQAVGLIGQGIIYALPGTYSFASPVIIGSTQDNIILMGAGKGQSTFIKTYTSGNLFTVLSADYFSAFDLKIISPPEALVTSSHIFDLANSDHCEFRGIRFESVGTGIYTDANCSHIEIERCDFYTTRSVARLYDDCVFVKNDISEGQTLFVRHRGEIKDNQFLTPIDITSANRGVYVQGNNAKITGNSFDGYFHSILIDPNTSGQMIASNSMINAGSVSVYIKSTKTTFAGNRITDSTGPALHIDSNASNVIVSHNYFNPLNGIASVNSYATDSLFIGNEFERSSGYTGLGIKTFDAPNQCIIGNHFMGGGGALAPAIHISSARAHAQSNNIYDWYYGILVQNYGNGSLSNNNYYDCYYGIFIGSGIPEEHVFVSNNEFYGEGEYGIYIDNSLVLPHLKSNDFHANFASRNIQWVLAINKPHSYNQVYEATYTVSPSGQATIIGASDVIAGDLEPGQYSITTENQDAVFQAKDQNGVYFEKGFWDNEEIQDEAGGMWTGNTETGITITYQDSDGTIDAALSDEYLQDTAGAMWSGNTETGGTITYQDADGTIDFSLDLEYIEDDIGAMVTGNTETNITVTYNDATNKLDFVVPVDTVLSEEQVEDYVGGMVIGNTETGLVVTYDDTAGVLNFVITDEYLQDTTGAMFSGNTETGIDVTYQDADGTVDLVVNLTYLDTKYLPLAGGTMAGAIAMGGNDISNVDDLTTDRLYFGNGEIDFLTGGLPAIYRAAGSGSQVPFTAAGNLVIQPRLDAARDIFFKLFGSQHRFASAGDIAFGTGVYSSPSGYTFWNNTPIMYLQDADSAGVAANPTLRGLESGGTTLWYIGSQSTSNNHVYLYNNQSDGNINFWTNATQRLAIDPDGNMILGSPFTPQSGYELTVNGDIYASGNLNASLSNGQIWQGDGSNRSTAVDFDETVEDQVGLMFTGNTESNITSTYNDGTGKVDMTVPVQEDDDNLVDTGTYDVANQPIDMDNKEIINISELQMNIYANTTGMATGTIRIIVP